MKIGSRRRGGLMEGGLRESDGCVAWMEARAGKSLRESGEDCLVESLGIRGTLGHVCG